MRSNPKALRPKPLRRPEGAAPGLVLRPMANEIDRIVGLLALRHAQYGELARAWLGEAGAAGEAPLRHPPPAGARHA